MPFKAKNPLNFIRFLHDTLNKSVSLLRPNKEAGGYCLQSMVYQYEYSNHNKHKSHTCLPVYTSLNKQTDKSVKIK